MLQYERKSTSFILKQHALSIPTITENEQRLQ